jgi:hypothetical protein
MSKPMLPNEAIIAAAANDITLPDGWTVDAASDGSLAAYANREQFAANIKRTLPLAIRCVEQLLEALDVDLRIILPKVYLVIHSEVDFQVYLPLDEATYHSPKKVAARLLVQRYVSELSDLSVREVFTIDEETNMAYLTAPHEYVLIYRQPA